MAKKNKARRKKPPIFLFSLGGLFIALIASLTIFNLMNPNYSYDDERFTHVASWNTFLSEQAPEDEVYLVYLYLETCGACIQIKQQVLSFAANNPQDIPMFLADANAPLLRATSNNRPGTSTAVPTMLLMQGNTVLQEVTGVTPVLNLLDDLRQ